MVRFLGRAEGPFELSSYELNVKPLYNVGQLGCPQEKGHSWISGVLGFCQLSMRVGIGVREGKVFSKLIVMMTMDSKLARNGSGLTVPAECVSVEITMLISMKKHVKVILEKKYWLII